MKLNFRVSSPYEAPHNPEIVVDTGSLDLNDSVEKLLTTLNKTFLTRPNKEYQLIYFKIIVNPIVDNLLFLAQSAYVDFL